MARNELTAGLRSVHPGEILREDVLPSLARPKAEIARLLGVSRQTLYDILDEKHAVTASMALRLGKLCGNGPQLWLALQQNFDIAVAMRDLGPVLAGIPTLEAVA